MSAKGYMDTIMDEVCCECESNFCELCKSFLIIKQAIAEAQLEAVEEYIKHEELAHAVSYLKQLRKAAGKGEI